MTDKPKSYIKAKEDKSQVGPGFRTHDHFKKSLFEGKQSISKFSGKSSISNNVAFNPSKFKTQHKG